MWVLLWISWILKGREESPYRCEAMLLFGNHLEWRFMCIAKWLPRGNLSLHDILIIEKPYQMKVRRMYM